MLIDLKNIIKNTIGLSAKFLNLLENKKNFGFVFHDVTDDPTDFQRKNKLYVTPNTFKNQIQWIKKYFHPVFPEEIYSTKKYDKNVVVISFDDGYAGAVMIGSKVLIRQSVPHIHFLNGNTVLGDISSFLASKRYFKSDGDDDGHLEDFELADLGKFSDTKLLVQTAESPYVRYGNHFLCHFSATELSSADFEFQTAKNVETLNQINMINHLALPFSELDHSSAVRLSSGLKTFHVVWGGPNTSYTKLDNFIKRVPLCEDENTEAKLIYRILKSNV